MSQCRRLTLKVVWAKPAPDLAARLRWVSMLIQPKVLPHAKVSYLFRQVISEFATDRRTPTPVSRPETKVRTRQRGVALLLMLLVVLMIGGTFGFKTLNTATAKDGIENSAATKILAQSKEALLAWAMMPDTTVSSLGYRGSRPGALPYPDVYGRDTSSSPIRYDGMQDRGCLPSNWTGTQTLVLPTGTPNPPTNIRCLGKLPWRLLGLQLLGLNFTTAFDRTTDGAGIVPWYAVSANLVDFNSASECPRRLDASVVTASATGCGVDASDIAPTLPFPWLSVRDQFGAILSTRVAAVLIMPGPPTARQTGTLTQNNRRLDTARPDQFLDTVRNSLCTPTGYCDNARISASPMEFIQCVPANTTMQDGRFTQPYSCNDQLIYITIDELMQAASDRVAREAITCLNAYGKANGTAPFADTTSDSDKNANPGLHAGLLPTSAPDAGAGVWPTACTYFTEIYWNSWQQVVSYNVSQKNTVTNTVDPRPWDSAGDLNDKSGNPSDYKVTLTMNVGSATRWYGIR